LLDFGARPSMLCAMAVSGTVPARVPKRVDPSRVARWVRRLTLLSAVGLLLWCYAVLGTEWVPPGMRTAPDIGPGSLCLVDRRASAVQVGRDVFVVADGVRLLTRVTAVDGDAVTVHNPDPMAPYPDSRVFGAIRRSQVRGVVLVVFTPDGDGAGGGG